MNPMPLRWMRLYKGTPAEHALEPAVAAMGTPYRFQHPLWLFDGRLRYFPDFLLLEHKVVIEVDDPGHKRKTKQVDDAARTADLQKAGYRVWRCTNKEALSDPYKTIARLRAELHI